MEYGNTKNLKVETKTFEQKINQFCVTQLTIPKKYYDIIYEEANSLDLKIDDYIIVSFLINIDKKEAFNYISNNIKYETDKNRLCNWIWN